MALVRADPELICVGLPESAYPVLPRGLVAGSALIRNPAGQSIHSQPQVQAFADAVMLSTGANSFGTYIGHDSPSPDLALDVFVPKAPRALADAVAQFAINNHRRFGIWYVIRRQQIWNPFVADYWRDMADRGNDTANHFDHDHISFLDDGPVVVVPPPAPVPQEEVTMFVFDGPAARGGGVWKSDGVFRNRITNGETWPALDAAGVNHIGVAPVGLFDDLIDADLEGYAGGVDLSAIADRVAAKVADLIADRLAS